MNGPHFTVEGRDYRPAGLHLLVVDANVDAADSTALLLRLWGYEVRVAYTGSDGLELARRFQPDVVFAELWLPGLDGCQLAQCLRAELTGVNLIALTGLGQPGDRLHSKDCGFAHHLVKPADPDEIHQLLTMIRYHKQMTAACQAEAATGTASKS
jgi:DNA-binding response OmpR family regulator